MKIFTGEDVENMNKMEIKIVNEGNNKSEIRKFKNLKDGHFEHLAEMLYKKQGNFDDCWDNETAFHEFEKWFYKYHSHVLLSEWRWYIGNKSFIFHQPLGVYDNLNTLARRIKNELFRYKEDVLDEKIVHIDYMGDKLEIRIYDDSNYISHVDYICEFITFNNTESGYSECEGYKFEMKELKTID